MTSDRKELEADLMHFVQSRGARYAQATLQTDLLETGMLDSSADGFDLPHRRGLWPAF